MLEQHRAKHETASDWTSGFYFDSTVSALGILGGALNNSWTYTAYDVFDNVIETINLTDP